MLRPKKSQAIALVSKSVPEYVEFFREFQSYDGGWLKWPDKLINIKNNLKLDSYVLLYEDQKKIDLYLLLFLMGEDGLKKWNKEFKEQDEEEQLASIDAFAQELIDESGELQEIIAEFPQTPEDEIEVVKQFELLNDEEKAAQIKSLTFLFLHILPAIHNYFAVMITGELMTSLVPKAIKGDQDAFCKAVKIDRNLIVSHPYFKQRYQEAQAKGERDFLRRISTNQVSPNLIGKIRYPGLYIVFAMLDALKWLNDLTASQILDICDAAQLDRWQNRIEDTVAVNKQLARYRRYQKTGGVSMH